MCHQFDLSAASAFLLQRGSDSPSPAHPRCGCASRSFHASSVARGWKKRVTCAENTCMSEQGSTRVRGQGSTRVSLGGLGVPVPRGCAPVPRGCRPSAACDAVGAGRVPAVDAGQGSVSARTRSVPCERSPRLFHFTAARNPAARGKKPSPYRPSLAARRSVNPAVYPPPAPSLPRRRCRAPARAAARLGSVRLSSARFGSARLGLARHRSAQLGSVRHRSAQLGSAGLGTSQLGSARRGWAWISSARLGAARPG